MSISYNTKKEKVTITLTWTETRQLISSTEARNKLAQLVEQTIKTT